ncbi:hypothetical protein TNCV_1795261 [Trichonephila clavipes]|nr:hypothetical protein TNCV_1795261 [Trichonephila clavipes]
MSVNEIGWTGLLQLLHKFKNEGVLLYTLRLIPVAVNSKQDNSHMLGLLTWTLFIVKQVDWVLLVKVLATYVRQNAYLKIDKQRFRWPYTFL